MWALWCGCVGPSRAAERTPHVVFVNPGKQGETFWDLTSQTMEIAAKQLDLKLEILWAERNKLNLRKLGLEVVARAEKPDYLVLVNEEDSALPVLQAAEQEGVKTLFFSNLIAPTELAELASSRGGRLHMLGSLEPDMRGAGRRMAERLIAAARERKLHSRDGKIHLLALAGDEISSNSIARTQGMLGYAKGQPDVAVDRLLFANWNAAEGEKLAGRYLDLLQRRGDKPGAIWAANDPIALGAIAALKAKELKPGRDAVVAGLNWSPDAVDQIERGELLLSDGGHFLGGGLAMVMLRDHTDGCFPKTGAPDKVVPISMGAIDRNTRPKVIAFLKERQFGRIDFRRLRLQDHACGGEYDFGVDALLRQLTDLN